MELLEKNWQDLVERVTEKVLFLEDLTEKISEEMAIRRAIREEWLDWNENWKSAWLFSQDERERFSTSVHIRLMEKKNSFPNS